MQKFPFVNNAKLIYEVAKEQRVDVGIAFDMVKADVRSGVPFNTKREDINFAILKSEFDALAALDGDVQGMAIDSWSEFYSKNFKALTEAWVSGNEAAFQEIIDNA